MGTVLKALLTELRVALGAELGENYLPKNKLVRVSSRDAEAVRELGQELSAMLGLSYKALGGYSGGTDLGAFSGFYVADIDSDADADIALYYKARQGTKIAAVASDGGAEAKTAVVDYLAELLTQHGFWIEVSGPLANVLLKKKGLRSQDDEQVVRKALGKPVTRHGASPEGLPYGKGWYTREIDGQMRTKIMVGNPG